jgi:hypothetical protein
MSIFTSVAKSDRVRLIFAVLALLAILSTTAATATSASPQGAGLAVAAAPSVGNGLGTIGDNPVPTQAAILALPPAETFGGNIDHAAAGTGARNTGNGTIRLRGIPAGATEQASRLYFSFICIGAVCPPAVPVTFDAFPAVGALVGSSPQPCWSSTTIGNYVADVSGLSSPTLNGDYFIEGIPSSKSDGSDPWTGVAVAPLAEGASLVTVYSLPSLPLAQVYINHGSQSINGGVGIVNNPIAPPPVGTYRKFTNIGSDGQVGSSVEASPSLTGKLTSIGPGGGALTLVAGPGATRNLSGQFNGNDGGPLNQLYDTQTLGVSGTIPAGVTSYDVRYDMKADCVVPQVHVLTAR